MTHSLIVAPNVSNPDEVYARLVGMHDGLSEAESVRLSAMLILLLVNHIGDSGVIFEAIDAASRQARATAR
jgi:hypothetical protein